MPAERSKHTRANVLVFLCASAITSGCASASQSTNPKLTPYKSGSFEAAPYEPSGAATLADGRVLVVGDEPEHPLDILTILADARISSAVVDSQGRGWNDLEDVTSDDRGYIYAITSHSLTKTGKDKPERRLLMRFKLSGNRIEDPKSFAGLKELLVSKDPSLKEAALLKPKEDGLDIEGLVWNPHTKSLMIGFRGPLVSGRAIVYSLVNCEGVFELGEPPQVSGPILLNLQGMGIRGMTYDSTLQSFLILCGPMGEEGSFRIWRWNGKDGNEPQPLDLDLSAVKQPEGITPVKIAGHPYLLIVSDEGDTAQRQPGAYLLLEYRE